MLRIILFSILIVFVARALAKIWRGLMEGLDGRSYADRASGVPSRGAQMVRDPVCGTFVLPERAVAVDVRGQRRYFCSTRCRDAFRDDSSMNLPGGSGRDTHRSSPGQGDGPERAGHSSSPSRGAA
jgi:YHS domain-containing protein